MMYESIERISDDGNTVTWRMSWYDGETHREKWITKNKEDEKDGLYEW